MRAAPTNNLCVLRNDLCELSRNLRILQRTYFARKLFYLCTVKFKIIFGVHWGHWWMCTVAKFYLLMTEFNMVLERRLLRVNVGYCKVMRCYRSDHLSENTVY